MKEQIIELLRREGLSANKLAGILEVQPSALSHIIAGRNKPGYDMIVRLLQAFPAYAPEWLILGKGEPLKSIEDTKSEPEPVGHDELFTDVTTITVSPQMQTDSQEQPLAVPDNNELIETPTLHVPPVSPASPAHDITSSQPLLFGKNDAESATEKSPETGPDTPIEEAKQPNGQSINQSDNQQNTLTEHQSQEPSIKKLIALYSDNTFEEYSRR